MKRPAFTDAGRFAPGGYVPAAKTDIAKTFARVRRQQAEQAKIEAEAQAEAQAEAKRKVRTIRRAVV